MFLNMYLELLSHGNVLLVLRSRANIREALGIYWSYFFFHASVIFLYNVRRKEDGKYILPNVNFGTGGARCELWCATTPTRGSQAIFTSGKIYFPYSQ